MGQRGGSIDRLRLPSPLIPLQDDRLASRGVEVWLKRDDLIHPELPGNKWRKLKYNLAEAAEQGHDTLLTFGGAYSNHVRATAAGGHYFGFSTIGVIRGEQHLPLNLSLAYAAGRGMQLTYLDRTTYRSKHSSEVVAQLRDRWGEFYLVPEGGSNEQAVRGHPARAAPGDRRSVHAPWRLVAVGPWLVASAALHHRAG